MTSSLDAVVGFARLPIPGNCQRSLQLLRPGILRCFSLSDDPGLLPSIFAEDLPEEEDRPVNCSPSLAPMMHAWWKSPAPRGLEAVTSQDPTLVHACASSACSVEFTHQLWFTLSVSLQHNIKQPQLPAQRVKKGL